MERLIAGLPLGLEYSKKSATCSSIWSTVVLSPRCFKIGVMTSSLVTKSSRPSDSLGLSTRRPELALDTRASLSAHFWQTGEHMAPVINPANFPRPNQATEQNGTAQKMHLDQKKVCVQCVCVHADVRICGSFKNPQKRWQLSDAARRVVYLDQGKLINYPSPLYLRGQGMHLHQKGQDACTYSHTTWRKWMTMVEGHTWRSSRARGRGLLEPQWQYRIEGVKQLGQNTKTGRIGNFHSRPWCGSWFWIFVSICQFLFEQPRRQKFLSR